MKFKKRDKYSGNVWLTTRIDWHLKFIVKLSLISWLPDRGRISPNLSVWKRERSIYANIAPIVIFNPLQVFVPNEAELYNPKHDWPNRQGLTDSRNFCFKIIFIVLGLIFDGGTTVYFGEPFSWLRKIWVFIFVFTFLRLRMWMKTVLCFCL